MKKLLLLCILVALSLPHVGAQTPDENGRFSVLSGRYGLEVPEGWIANYEAVVPDIQIFNTEILTIVDSEATLEIARDPNYDLTAQGLPGAIIFGVSWPSIFLESQNVTLQTLADSLKGSFTDVQEENLTGETHSGIILTGTMANTFHEIHLLVDKSDNIFIVWGVSDESHQPALQEALDSLIIENIPFFKLIDPTRLAMPVDLINQQVKVDLPYGWWVIDTGETGIVTMPELRGGFLQALSSGQMQGVSGVFLMAEIDSKANLPEGSFNPDGGLNAEVFAQNASLNNLMNSDDIRLVTVEPMTTDQNENGVKMEMEIAQQGIYATALFLEAGENYVMLLAASATNQFNDYRPVIEAIFKTARITE
jgi:hypothetical protein